MSGRVTPIRIGDIQKHPRPGMAAPGLVRFTPDSRGVTYVYSAEGSLVRSLWRYDIATGERRVLAGPPPASTSEAGLSREEELRRERARLRELGVTDYAFATKAERETLLVPSGDGLRVRVGDEELRLLEGTAGAIDPRLSPDGKLVAFVRDGELCVVATAGGAVRQLTMGAEDGLTNGLAEFIAQEELDRPNGFWWSADSTRLAYVRADSRHIAKYPIVHQGKDEVDVEEHRYPFAGDANAYVELGVVSAEGGETTWMDLGREKDIYLARAGWTPDGRLTAQVLSRDQRRLTLLRFDAKGAATVLIDERQEPWVNLHYDLRFLESGEMLWSSEKSGYRHLYVHDGAGKEVRQLTSGPWMVLRVVEVDEKKGLVYFAGTKDSVLRRHLYAVPLKGGRVKRVTSGDGCHDAVVAKDGRHFIERSASLEAAPVLTVRKMDGTAVAALFDNGGLTAGAIGLPVPELLTLKANDGTLLHGALYRPKTDALGTPPPLVVSVYGGPHAQRVEDEWNLTVDLRAQYLAEAGFAVFKLDNRGSANRGLAFEGHLNRRMGTVEVEDQVTGVRWLAERGEIDPERVGIFGWSYGGI